MWVRDNGDIASTLCLRTVSSSVVVMVQAVPPTASSRARRHGVDIDANELAIDGQALYPGIRLGELGAHRHHQIRRREQILHRPKGQRGTQTEGMIVSDNALGRVGDDNRRPQSDREALQGIGAGDTAAAGDEYGPACLLQQSGCFADRFGRR
jgi:hypothetical protein